MADFAGPAQRRRRLTFAGVVTGITSVYSEARQKSEPAPERHKGGMVRGQKREKVFEQVDSPERQSELYQQSFEILFGGLLTVKALFVMKWFVSSGDGGGELEVAFGFANPSARRPFHRGSCLCW